MKVKGGCHCGAVRFASEVELPAKVLDCNCSICSMTGFLHLIIPHKKFTLLQGEAQIESYQFGTGTAAHLFCRTCGIKSYYQPRSHPDCWSVNLRCLDPGHGLKIEIVLFDGRNWERAQGEI